MLTHSATDSKSVGAGEPGPPLARGSAPGLFRLLTDGGKRFILHGTRYDKGIPMTRRRFHFTLGLSGLALTAGLVLGGWLTQLLTWRSVFAISVLFAVPLLLAAR